MNHRLKRIEAREDRRTLIELVVIIGAALVIFLLGYAGLVLIGTILVHAKDIDKAGEFTSRYPILGPSIGAGLLLFVIGVYWKAIKRRAK